MPRDFQEALDHVTAALARMIVKDGEGVSRFIDLHVHGRAQRAGGAPGGPGDCELHAREMRLVWRRPELGPHDGRRSATPARDIREERIRISYDGLVAVEGGMPSAVSPARLRKVTRKKEFTITVELGMGKGCHRIWTTDLTSKYVEFNMGE